MPETTDQYHHIPVKDKDLFVMGSFATIDISKEQGIKAVIGKLKSDPQGATHIQKYLFDVEKFSMAEAEKWVNDHKRVSGKLEIRSFDTEIRFSLEDHNLSKLAGLAIPYNRLSDNPIKGLEGAKERILPSAFKRSLGDGHDILMLYRHNPERVFGRTKRGTLQLHETNDGVNFENIPPESQWVKDLLPSIKRGDISNMSFGFVDTLPATWTKEDGQYVRNVREAHLAEISLVADPAYESSTVCVRTADLMIVDGIALDYVSPQTIMEAEKAKDERFDNMMNQYESLRKQWS